ncbi:LysM peptidoglycan-binding domain-containing protein [Neobacillus niacini]|uniref:LysM peptidoglycan-binding domain-containing protein n=1 Tax=Neobacillus niacini TaxID=86668 RepID=UPI0005EDB8A2|nr:LysM peptidoglycan-binding domain-containing protein [Neobacillus niacini]
MNKEEPFRSQAERLKQRIEKINEESSEVRDKLPPREQIHREKRKKTKWKLKYPIIRILVLFFILLPIVIFSAYSYLEEGKNQKTEKVTGESSGYEVINFEKTETESNVETKVEEKEIASVEKGEEAIEVGQSISPDTPIEGQASEPSNISGQGTDKNVSTSSEPAAPQVIYHTVKSGENLYRIALKYYHSKAGEDIIRKANNIKGNEIYLGQVLKIPLNK